MALQRRFQTPIDPSQEDPAYQPGALKPGLMRRGGATGTGIRETMPIPSPTPESGPYTPIQPPAPPNLGGVTATGASVGQAQQPYDTDGYAAPGYMTRAGQTQLGGYESSKLGSMAHQTPKYAVARIVSNYADTPEGLRQALPDLQRAYPGVQITGSSGDKLDFRNSNVPELGIVDVGNKFSTGGGQGYHWLPTAAESTAPDSPLTGGGVPITQQPTERNAILEMLEADGKKPLRTAQYRGRPEAF